MKCLKCDKEAIFGNYCQDHAAETGTILGEVDRGRSGDINADICPPCAAPDDFLNEKPEKTSK